MSTCCRVNHEEMTGLLLGKGGRLSLARVTICCCFHQSFVKLRLSVGTTTTVKGTRQTCVTPNWCLWVSVLSPQPTIPVPKYLIPNTGNVTTIKQVSWSLMISRQSIPIKNTEPLHHSFFPTFSANANDQGSFMAATGLVVSDRKYQKIIKFMAICKLWPY